MMYIRLLNSYTYSYVTLMFYFLSVYLRLEPSEFRTHF